MTPDAPTPAEDRVSEWLELWVAGRLAETDLEALCHKWLWATEGTHPYLHSAIEDEMRYALVQWRDSHDEWLATEPDACGAAKDFDAPAECSHDATCGRHRLHLYDRFGRRDVFVAQLIAGVPARARARARKVGVL